MIKFVVIQPNPIQKENKINNKTQSNSSTKNFQIFIILCFLKTIYNYYNNITK